MKHLNEDKVWELLGGYEGIQKKFVLYEQPCSSLSDKVGNIAIKINPFDVFRR